jgi:hypothetical protein
MCSCVVTVAAAAQDTAEGAVVVAAGGAAGDPSEAASAVRIFTGELRSDDSSDLRQINMCSCVVTVATAAQNLKGADGGAARDDAAMTQQVMVSRR